MKTQGFFIDSSANSFFSLIFQGGLLSIIVLVILLGMSILSWSIICRKWLLYQSAIKTTKKFLETVDLNSGLSDVLYRSELFSTTYVAKIFQSAFKEFKSGRKIMKQPLGKEDIQKLLLRIERQIEKQIGSLYAYYEKDLNILATISSSAPFIGLFGTVTGIIDAFYSIGFQGSASLAVVAPGISAALVATAFGLFAAIPALIAYNVFRNKSRIITNEMKSFGLDLLIFFEKGFSSENETRKKPLKSVIPSKIN